MAKYLLQSARTNRLQSFSARPFYSQLKNVGNVSLKEADILAKIDNSTHTFNYGSPLVGDLQNRIILYDGYAPGVLRFKSNPFYRIMRLGFYYSVFHFYPAAAAANFAFASCK